MLDWSQCPVVESVPGKRSGAWVFRDTRTPVSVVFDNLEAGVEQSLDGLTRHGAEGISQGKGTEQHVGPLPVSFGPLNARFQRTTRPAKSMVDSQ